MSVGFMLCTHNYVASVVQDGCFLDFVFILWPHNILRNWTKTCHKSKSKAPFTRHGLFCFFLDSLILRTSDLPYDPHLSTMRNMTQNWYQYVFSQLIPIFLYKMDFFDHLSFWVPVFFFFFFLRDNYNILFEPFFL